MEKRFTQDKMLKVHMSLRRKIEILIDFRLSIIHVNILEVTTGKKMSKSKEDRKAGRKE